MTRSLRVDCPAKINLFLEILGRRPDGYHDLATVMAPIDLRDTLVVREARRFTLAVEGARLDRPNTVEKAWRAVRRRRPIPPVSVRLVKRIPAGSGLGGGSSDAAAMIAALDALFGLGLDLREAGAEVGSDVNFFLEGGQALCTGRGEEVAPLARGLRAHAVVVWPGVPLLTAAVYRRARDFLTPPRRDVIDFLNSMAGGSVERAGRALFNRLEPAAFAIEPGLSPLLARLRRLPFAGVRMTGSGSALYGLCGSRAEAERLARRARSGTDALVAAASLLVGETPWKSPRSGSSSCPSATTSSEPSARSRSTTPSSSATSR